ncbi:cysteine-rich secretory protein 2-like isoform X1 [Hyla sarda]|uniref:cysteine-rich secretory protein 2-like isoform X1 n=1 Tax=Hyla sarda TaxID=327740 RepID=UPI0024C28E54|nr:cysteine-rich secretory protein 2-like isoform X1 [Hyla sarda]
MEILNVHNDIRQKVEPSAANMEKMVWNEEAALNAMNFAAKCIDDHSNVKYRVIKRPNVHSCGENLLFSSAKTPWSAVINEWASENEDFTYGVGSNGNPVGHYTQVVWWNSVHSGCGAAKCDNLKYPYFYVCHYCPAGNDWENRNTPYKLGRRCSQCNGGCDNGLCVS